MPQKIAPTNNVYRVSYRLPLVECGDGHVFWTSIKENRHFIVQRHKMGGIGQIFRQAKMDHDPQQYRIITSSNPFYEIVVSNTEEGILFALDLLEKELIPRVFGLSQKRIIALLPDLIKALQSGKMSELDAVMTKYYSFHKPGLITSCGENSPDVEPERFVHQPVCLSCANGLGEACPTCTQRSPLS